MGKKEIVKDRSSLVNLLAKLEQTTKQASVNAYRQAFKKLLELEVAARKNGFASPLLMLRREAIARIKGKKK